MNRVAKVIEIISESPDSVEDAVQQGIERAAKTLDGIKGAWISETKVVTDPDGRIIAWRVCLRVSFILD
ncbi:dodecin family protein [Rhodanobacter umsongensis]|uniref:Dodecin family protein n=1 Tax=Rhodanobacter umsongensis TaxID=633153 RepID=A0ABW0JFY0_9GAMM